MAYIEYIACDKCGADMLLSVDRSFGITFARSYARKNGWQVGKNGWICPKCQRRVKDGERKKAD